MFSYLCGSIVQKGKDCCIVENQGIGYRLAVPSSALALLPDNGQVKLHTYLAVREDGLALYGFPTAAELELFELLLTVSGIGPKAALGVLSAMAPDAFYLAVLQEDVRALTGVPGIGTKSAKRLILELKDRVAAFNVRHAPKEGQGLAGDAYSDALSALVALGYNSMQAQGALRTAVGNAEENLSVQELLKKALKQLVPGGAGPTLEKEARDQT